MNDTLASALLDAVLYAGTTAGLSLTTREFGLYNLAGGSWLILGGWLASSVLGYFTGQHIPVSPWAFLLFLPFLAGQILAPLLLKNKIRQSSLSYLFVGLGTTLIVSRLASAVLLSSSGATIPIERSRANITATLAACTAVMILTFYVFKSKWWARLVLDFRLSKATPGVWRGLSILIGLEILLLLILGASGICVHKGVFGTAEYRTVIPILALVAARGRSLRGSFLSFSMVLLGHFLTAFSPRVTGFSLGSYPQVVSILALLGLVLSAAYPRRALKAAQVVSPISLRGSWAIVSDRSLLHAVMGCIVIVLITIGGYLFSAAYPSLLTEEDIHKVLYICVLAAISWIAQSLLGVSTIAWPMIGILPMYPVLAMGLSFWSSALILILLASMSVHLWLMRVLPHEPAFVADLAAVVCVVQIVKSSPSILGETEVRMFTLSQLRWINHSGLLALQALIVLCSIVFLAIVNRLGRFRALGISIANFRLGLSHGVPVRALFLFLAVVLIGLTVLSSCAFHLVSEPISITDISLESGLLIFLLGYLLRRSGSILAFLFIFSVYALLASFLSRFGALFGAIIGICLLAASFLFREAGGYGRPRAS